MRYFEDICVGESFPLGNETVKREEMDTFARKYNRSYLHTDEEYMEKTKYGGLISPGMYTFSIPWAAFIDLDVFERGEVGGMKTTVEWFKGVYAGDLLSSEATIVEKRNHNNALGIVAVEIRTFNQHGKMVIKSVNELLIRKRPQKEVRN